MCSRSEIISLVAGFLLICTGPAAHASLRADCIKKSQKMIKSQFKGLSTVKSIEQRGGKAHYAFKVGVYQCQLDKLKHAFTKEKNWKKVCPGQRAINRSACLLAWMKKNRPSSGSSLLRLSKLITTASTADRDEVQKLERKIKRNKKKPTAKLKKVWPNTFGVQATQNLAFLLEGLEIEKFHYYKLKMDSEELKNLIRVEEGPLKMAISNLTSTAETLNKNYRALYDRDPPKDEATQEWVFKSLTRVGEILDRHREREFKWRLDSSKK